MKKKILIPILIVLIVIIAFIVIKYFNANQKADTYIYDKNGKEIAVISYGDVNYFNEVKSYYIASALESILNDMIVNENITETEAEEKLVTSGYKIYLCMDYEEQNKLEKIYNNNDIFSEEMESATVVLDNDTGEVRAIIGGRNEDDGVITFGEYNKNANNYTNKNKAIEELFQPGTMLSDISVYACGLEKGIITLNSVYSDDPVVTESGWRPMNLYKESQGDITIKKAIDTNSNMVRVRVLEDIGIDVSYEFLESIGITSLQDTDKNLPCLSLGGLTKGVSVIEISSAYRTILNDGKYREPIFYNKVVDKKGKNYLDNKSEVKVVVKEDVCKQLKDVYKDNINNKAVYFKATSANSNKEHWANVVTEKYTYTTICYLEEHKTMTTEKNVAQEVLTGIIK